MRQIEFEIHADFCWLWELRYVDRRTDRQTGRRTSRRRNADTHTQTRVEHDNASFLALTRTKARFTYVLGEAYGDVCVSVCVRVCKCEHLAYVVVSLLSKRKKPLTRFWRVADFVV